MASVNKVILVGNLGADLEARYTQGGGNSGQQQRQPQRQAYDDLGDDIPF